MARQKGTASLSGTIEVQAGGPLDTRTVVPTLADLTVESNFPYAYIGLETYVVAENKKYRLIDNDPTTLDSWEELNIIDNALSELSENSVQNKIVKGALDTKVPLSLVGAANGLAELDANGKVPASQLPSYVDDVIEGYYNAETDRFYEDNAFTTVITPVEGKSWVDIPSNKSYRWTGSVYTRVDEGVQLGETSDTAYRGDKGKIAYDDSQANKTAIGDLSELETTVKSDLVSAINEASKSGGSSALASNVTANTTIGAISSGTTLNEGTTFTEFVQKLLISEIAPTTSFSAGGSGTKETGTSVTPTLTLNITDKGTGIPSIIKFYNGSTLLDSQTYVNGTNTYTYTMETAITTTTTVKGVLEYTKSDGASASIEKSASYTFVMASYYGAVTTAPTNKAGIIALTKVVKTAKGQTATFNLSNQRSCYCYPASMGNLTSIKDANNFEYISSYTKTTVAVDGIDYNVYTLTDPVTATGFKQIYA